MLRDYLEIEIQKAKFSLDNIRTISLRRSLVNIKKLGQKARQTLKK
jgi:hypothetical protein